MVSSPAGIGEMMHKVLTVAVGEVSRQSCIGVPCLRASTTAAVAGWPHPQMSSQPHAPHEFGAPGLAANPQCSVFQQYPALQLLLDPVQWPPIGHRAHVLTAVRKMFVDAPRSDRGGALQTAAEKHGLRISTVDSNKILSEISNFNHTGLEKQNNALGVDVAENLTSVATGSSSELLAETSDPCAATAEKKKAKRSRRHSAQSSQIAELRQRLHAQKLLSVKSEMQHGQRSALRAWAAECKRAVAAVAHKNELENLTSHAVVDQQKLEEKLEFASTKFAHQISRLESVVQCSRKELRERRLFALSPCGRRWRLQRVALQLWTAACSQGKSNSMHQQHCEQTKTRRSMTPVLTSAPPLPSIAEVAECSSDSERQIDLVTGSIEASATDPDVSTRIDMCDCDRTWGCIHHKMYSKGVLLLQRQVAQQLAQGPPGLFLGNGGALRDAHHFKVVPRVPPGLSFGGGGTLRDARQFKVVPCN